MSNDRLVSLPSDVFDGSQKFEIIQLLVAVARAAVPGAAAGLIAERDLEARFSGVSSIGLPDAAGWLAEHSIKVQSLDGQVTSLLNGDPEQLHQVLQAGNDAQCVQLLAVNDASKLVEMQDNGEDQLTPHAMWTKQEPCLLLRVGYSVDQDYAYYAASLPGDSRRYIKITWASVVAAGVSGAVAIMPPAKPVDLDRVNSSLTILTQALATARLAHADILDALGQPAPAAPAVAEQAV